MDYYELEPWGEERADLRIGTLAAATVNLHLKKGAKPFRAPDFMPYLGSKPEAAASAAEIKSVLRSVAGGPRRD